MELKVNSITIPEVIEFNYEELKAEITEKVKTYSSIVYGEDEIKQAKADKANLNKFVKALSDERIRVKNQCLQPYVDFEEKVKEITAIVQESITNIDKQIKAYDEQKKAEKLEQVKALFGELEHPDWLVYEQIHNDKYLNASMNMANVKQYLLDTIKRINADTEIINNLPEYSFEALAVYKECIDLNRAVNEAKRMVDIANAKEQTKTAEEPKDAELGMKVETDDNEPKEWVKFQAYMTVQQAKDLAWFFRTKNIDFKPV